jgi:6-phosphogluconolactonase (cycloisomerase 2 family)
MRYTRLVLFSLSILAISVLLSSCGGALMADSKSPAPGTGPAPTVVAVGEQVNGVAPNRKQEVQFSEAMDSATINAQSFQVADSSGKMVQGAVSYDSDFNTASFFPNSPLQINASYTATITTAASSAGGVHLASPYIYTFDTRATTDTSPLIVNSVNPASKTTCISATTPITITFDEAPDPATLIPANLAVSGPGGAIPVKVSTNVTTTQVVLTPTSPLPSGTITVTVGNVADLAGVKMTTPYVWNFSTSCGGTKHLYVTNFGSSSISLYNMDLTTGGLAFVTTFATPLNPFSLEFSGSRSFAYLASGGGNTTISTFAVDATAGSLTLVGSLGLSAPSLSQAIDPSGNYLLVSDNSFTVTTYHINSNGSFSPASSIKASNPLGRMVFVTPSVAYAGGSGNVLTQLSFSPATGALSEVGTTTVGPLPPSVGKGLPYGIYAVLHPSGKYLYVVNIVARNVAGFFVDQTSGALTQFPGAPYSLSVPALGFAFAGSGKFAFVGNPIVGLNVGSDGSLSALQTTPTATPLGGNISLTADPSGKYLYAVSLDTNLITGYSVDQTTGALTQITGLPLPTSIEPDQAVFAP